MRLALAAAVLAVSTTAFADPPKPVVRPSVPGRVRSAAGSGGSSSGKFSGVCLVESLEIGEVSSVAHLDCGQGPHPSGMFQHTGHDHWYEALTYAMRNSKKIFVNIVDHRLKSVMETRIAIH